MRILEIWLFVTLLGAAVCDGKSRKIPGIWTYGAMAGGLAVVMLCAEEGSVLRASGGYAGRVLLTCGALFPLFLLRLMGGGDIKWMAVIMGCLGISAGIDVLFYGCAAGGVLAFANLLTKRQARRCLRHRIAWIRHGFLTKEWSSYGFWRSGEPEDGIPLVTCLFAGLVWQMVCQWF